MTLVQVRLFRDSFQTPWGFRLQGGKDLSQPLTIQRVFANTPSEGELHRGDVIVAINGRDTSNFTHKAAQDAISGGGGQIELLVSRPPAGQVHITPLSPVRDTRAPAYPNTNPPHITIPVHKHSGPKSPSRIIPISPQKPAPPKSSPPKPAPKPTAAPDMSAAGHIPTKITLNKYGGGGMDFGYSPKSPPVQGYRSVAGPAVDHTDYAPTRQHTQFSAPQQSQFSPQPASAPAGESGVAEEEYKAVSDRRKTFLPATPKPPNALDEDDYPTAPVWERRKLFGKRRSPPRAAQRSAHSKPALSFGKPRLGEGPVSFGVDYTKPHTMRQEPKPKPQRERPPAVNARRPDDETDYSWGNTLRSDGRNLKPWELEAMESEKYQSASMEDPYRPSMAPPTAPKPKASQMSPQRSVPPYHPPSHPARNPVPPQHSPYASNYGIAGGAAAPQQDGAKYVHLQYNSPMGLYSQNNIQDAYIGQTRGQAQSPSSGQQGQKPVTQIGDRDWSDSAVYKLVHSEKTTTTSTRQDVPGGPPRGETVTTTRITDESKYPGQPPQRHVTETVQRGGAPNYVFDNAIGMSDF